MTDPNTPTQPTNNPQDLIDQALGGTPAPAVIPDPTPTLPVPEPLTPPAAVTEEAPMSTESALPPTETVPTELTAKPEVAPIMSEPPVDTKPMGEDMPLAFAAGVANQVNEPTIAPVAPLDMSSATSIVPPAITQPNTDAKSIDKSKSRLASVKTVLVAVLAFVGVMSAAGYWAYNKYGTVEPTTIAAVSSMSEAECSGCSKPQNGGWLVWRNGQCKVSGTCNSTANNPSNQNTQNPQDTKAENASSASQCGSANGVWCASVDASNKPYGFCIAQSSSKGCNQEAIDRGITIPVGSVTCICKDAKVGTAGCQNWGVSDETMAAMEGASVSDATKKDNINNANSQCANGGNFTAAGKESYICKEGTVGEGGQVYSGGPCTQLNGKKFTGNLGCFCGTVQVDTTNGHTSYSSTCGCNKPAAENTPNPSPSVTPTLMCSSLTKTPTTTPEVGDKVTFTCVGASTPAGAVSLTYKFRYSLNSGAYVAMTNKTATTSELTIASCGSYKVQCQACGTINGVLTCDPNWTAATQ